MHWRSTRRRAKRRADACTGRHDRSEQVVDLPVDRTDAVVTAVVNGGGLGQLGDIVHNFNTALTGRQKQFAI